MTIKDKISAPQLIGTFGVGALYDLRQYTKEGQTVTSVTIGGLDAWEPHKAGMPRISEPTLQHALGVDELLEPPGCPDERQFWEPSFTGPYVPVFRFPEWMVCSKCSRLGRIGREFNEKGGSNRCKANRCGGHGVPVRLISTCFHAASASSDQGPHPGHVDDFPWHWWAHSRAPESDCPPEVPQLKLIRSGTSAAIAALTVECHRKECKKKNVRRSLDGVFGDNALRGRTCDGRRPWLEDHESCGRNVRTMMRGASNVYFPVTASALSIPPVSTACKQAVYEVCSKQRAAVNTWLAGSLPLEVLVQIFCNAQPRLRNYPTEVVVEAIQGFVPGHVGADPLPSTDAEQRKLEREAIISGVSDEDGTGHSLFQSRPLTAAQIAVGGPFLSEGVGALALIPRLREVRALRGFQRLEASVGDPYTSPCAPLSRTAVRWLPAIQVYGEGIYFELATDPLSQWLARSNVRTRVGRLEARYSKAHPNRDAAFITPEFVLIHTLTHLLINQLSLDCGYSSSSLRERIYAASDEDGTPRAGALIFTSTGCSDGTLGGLVRQGEPDLFGQTMEAAIENAGWCSSDPLCIESAGQGVDALNFAACHACAIVSETSCEHRNSFLDRALIVGTPMEPELAFFGSPATHRIATD